MNYVNFKAQVTLLISALFLLAGTLVPAAQQTGLAARRALQTLGGSSRRITAPRSRAYTVQPMIPRVQVPEAVETSKNTLSRYDVSSNAPTQSAWTTSGQPIRWHGTQPARAARMRTHLGGVAAARMYSTPASWQPKPGLPKTIKDEDLVVLSNKEAFIDLIEKEINHVKRLQRALNKYSEKDRREGKFISVNYKGVSYSFDYQIKPILEEINASGLTLSGIKLNDFIIRNCKFDNVILDNSTCIGTRFEHNSLKNSSLKRMDARNSVWLSNDLAGAEADNSTFEEANLGIGHSKSAIVRGSISGELKVDSYNIVEYDAPNSLKNVSFKKANLYGTRFGISDVAGADFTDALINTKTELRSVKLSEIQKKQIDSAINEFTREEALREEAQRLKKEQEERRKREANKSWYQKIYENAYKRVFGDEGQQSPHLLAMTEDDARTILGVDAQATPAEIKTVYRTLVKQWHPDTMSAQHKQSDPNGENIKKINEAYALLKNLNNK